MSSWIPTKYRTLNWAEYNLSLKQRGSLSIWFDPQIALDPRAPTALLTSSHCLATSSGPTRRRARAREQRGTSQPTQRTCPTLVRATYRRTDTDNPL